MAQNPVVHFEILGSDGPALTEFYGSLFGWQLHVGPVPGYAHYGHLPGADRPGIGGGVGQADAVADHLVTIYVEVDDIHAVLVRAQELGAEITMPVTEIPGVVTLARFRDPQGNEVGLVLP